MSAQARNGDKRIPHSFKQLEGVQRRCLPSLYGRVLAPLQTGHVEDMFNVVSNTSVTNPATERASSPLSALINNSTDANGQPVFAKVVRDALNKMTSNPAGQSDTSSRTADSSQSGQTFATSLLPNGRPFGIPATSKQDSKRQAQPSSNAPAILQALLTPALSMLSPAILENDQSTAAAPEEPISGNTTVAPATSADAGKQTLKVTTDTNEALPFSSQLMAQLAAVSPVSSAASDGDATSPVDPPGSTNAKSTLPPATIVSAATSAASAAATTAASAALQTSALAEAAQTTPAAAPPMATPQKTGVIAQVSIVSPNPQQGQPLSPILQQVAVLQRATPSRPSAPSVTVDLAPMAVQSQLVQAASKTALTPSSIPRTLAGADALTSAEIKGKQSISLQTRATEKTVQKAANAAVTPSNHSSSENSSSNQSGHKASDFSAPSDSSSTEVPLAKSESSSFSDALSVAFVSKPDAALVAQGASIAVSPPATSTQLTEIPARSTPDAPPSAPAQTQPPLPSLHTPDVPSGRFVNDAQLTNAPGHSEMRIAMQTDKLGAIELHARVSGDQVGAAIIVEKRDAHAALAVELPALQQALSEKQLRIEQVVLTQGSLSSTAGDAGANAQHNQRGTAQTSRAASFWNEARSLSTAAWFVPEQTGIFTSQGRLSVQA